MYWIKNQVGSKYILYICLFSAPYLSKCLTRIDFILSDESYPRLQKDMQNESRNPLIDVEDLVRWFLEYDGKHKNTISDGQTELRWFLKYDHKQNFVDF